jgi:hypothetical protein
LWQTIKNLILRLFGVKPKQTDTEIQRSAADVRAYQDTTRENLTAVFANALSVLAFGDSSAAVETPGGKEPTQRTQLLDEVLQDMWRNIKRNIAIGNGCGMIVSLPYSVGTSTGRKIYVDTVTKDRVYITGIQGDDITAITVLSDIAHIDRKTYVRWTDYSVENNVYIIRQKATYENQPCELTEVDAWANITPEIRILGVDRLPVGIYKCPTSNRRPKIIDGVPLTYGCEPTMNKIAKCFADIEKEFKNKEARIFADAKLFDGEEQLSDLYKNIRSLGKLGEGKNIDIFDPAFRDTSYFNRLDKYFELLEREVGTSRGILTDLNTSGATATEIKRATYQTYALCDDIRANAKAYIDGLMYGVNVLANYYGLTPQSEYTVTYNWAYSMLEDTDSTFRQLLEAWKIGAVGDDEVRAFIITNESGEDAQKKLEQIRQSCNGNGALEVQQKIWLGEVSSGLMSPVAYRMKLYGEDEKTAKAMLPNAFAGGEE